MLKEEEEWLLEFYINLQSRLGLEEKVLEMKMYVSLDS